MSNAFARLDNADMALASYEQVIRHDRGLENNSAQVAQDLQHYQDLLELKKKHVSAIGWRGGSLWTQP